MIKFFKREFGPYFRDFSEYDFKFFRTFRDSFLRPARVIEANDGTYTGELKFTFNIFTVLFILYYITNPSWVDGIEAYNLWRYPLPHQHYLKLNQSIDEDYYGYLMAVSFIPLYFILLKLFFYKRKPWGFFLSAAFYVTSVIFTLLIASVFILNALEIESELIIIPWLLSITVFPVIALNIQHWFLSSIKAMIAAVIPIIVAPIYIENPLFNLIINLSTNEEVLEMRPDNQLILSTKQFPIEPGEVRQVILTNKKNFVVLGSTNLSWIKEGNVVKEIPLTDYYSKKIVRIGNGPYLVTCFHDRKEVALTLYSSNGDTLTNKRFETNSQGKQLSFKRNDKNHFEAFVSNLQIKVIQDSTGWDLVSTQKVSDIKTFTSFTYFENNQSLRETIRWGNHHVLSFNLGVADSLDQLIWNHAMYQKDAPFDPLDLLMTHVDTAVEVVYAHYTLANDSIYNSHLYAIDIKTGDQIWGNTFSIPAHVTEYEGLTADKDFIYLYGEGHKFYSEWFWQPTYHIGLIVKIDKKTGDYINHVFLGPEEHWNAHSHIYSVYTEGDSLHILSFDKYKEPLPWEDVDDLILKTIGKDF